MKLNAIRLKSGAVPFLKTNVPIPQIPVGTQTLVFFPDRLLVYEPQGVGAVGYRDLSVEIEPTRFIEREGVPRDARVVDQTWKYVNKNGGPDRRFKDNPEIPIVEYESVLFKSRTGLKELIHCSKVGVAQRFEQSVRELAGRIAPAEQAIEKRRPSDTLRERVTP